MKGDRPHFFTLKELGLGWRPDAAAARLYVPQDIPEIAQNCEDLHRQCGS
jgi:hypothetical protein